jgi:MFS family permease
LAKLKKTANDVHIFWSEQTSNYKAFLARDVISKLLGNIGGQYSTIYLRTLGASITDVSLLSSMGELIRVLLSLPAGIITDRSKKIRRLYLTGRFMALPVNLFLAFATSWPVIFAARLWEIVTWRILMPTGHIISIAAVKNKDRVKALVLNRTLISAIGLIAPFISAYAVTFFGGLEEVASFRPLFLIQFASVLVIFLILASMLSEPEFKRPEDLQVNPFRSTMGIFQQVRGLRMILLLNIVRTFFIRIRTPLMQLYFYEVKNADAFTLAYQNTVSTGVTLLLGMPIGNLDKRLGRRRMGYVSQIMYAICVLAAVLTPIDRPILLLVYSAFSSLGMAFDVGWNAYIHEYIPLDTRGRYMGVNTTLCSLVGIAAPLIGGYIWRINPDYLWWISFVFYLFLAIPLRMSVPKHQDEV